MAVLEIELLPALTDNYIYLLREPGSGTVAVVDPGEAQPVIDALDRHGWTLGMIINTHHHGDHIGGNAALKRRYGAVLAAPARDRHRIPDIDIPLSEGSMLEVGDQTAAVMETPGHTSGHIALWFAESRALFCGDTLFALGCGRLLEGSAAEMWHSLDRLRRLPDDASIYCGHEYTLANARFARTIDPGNPDLEERAAMFEVQARRGPTLPTLLGAEKRTSPFLRADEPALARAVGLPGADPVAVFAEIRTRKNAF